MQLLVHIYFHLSFSFNSTTAKFNNSTGALISGKTYSGGMTSILPRGGITSTGSYYMMMMSMSGFGHNYHVIKTDVGGVMNNPACPEGTYSPTRNNYSASLTTMTPPAIINTASSSSFTPAIVNLTPGEIVDCEYAPCTPPPVPTLTAVPNPICAGQTVTLTASGSGLNVTYHYYTVPTGGTAFASGPSTDVTPGTTTTYYAAAEDNTNPGCMSDRASVIVTVNPNPVVSISPSAPSICQGESVSMTASGASSYNWSGLGAGATQNVSPGSTTTYTVTGTTGSCTGTTQVTVTVNSIPVVSISPSSATICSGESVSLTASGATTYNWSGLGAGATQNVSPATTTTYTVTGTNGTCTGSTEVTVNVNPSPTVTISPSSATICQGNSVSMTANGADTYNWSGLGAGATQNVSPGSSTTYTVTGTTGSCSGTSEIAITVSPNPVVTINPSSPSICQGNSVSLSASGADSYNWTGLGAGANQNVSPGVTTTYTVTGTTGACTGSSQVTVTVNANPVVSISPSAPSICEGQSVVITANGADSYNWAGLGTGPSHSVNPSATTSYTVTGTTGSCTGSASVTINVSSQFDASITPVAPVCSYEASFNFNATDNGGIWSGTGITDQNNGTFDPSAAGPGTHQIVYTISGSCGDSDTISIIVNAAPVIDIGVDYSICSGETTTLDAGTGFTSYQWSPSGSTQTIVVNSQNTYSVTVTDNNGCQTTDAITITVIPQMDATILSAGPFCSNSSSQQFYSQDSGGTWSGNGITSGGVFNPSSAGAGVHEIIYTISGSCGDADTVDVTVYAAPIVDLGLDFDLCDGSNATLDAGAGYSNYAWLPSGSSQTINVTSGGTYSVTVTDANNCQGTDNITVTIITQQDATIITTGPFCSNDSPVQFNAQDPGGVWSGTGISGSGLFNPSGAGAGTHTITYGIAGSCGDTSTVQITVNAAPVVNLGPDASICEGESLTLDAGSGASYIWSPSGSTQTINVTTGGTYSVTVTDGNGCEGTDVIIVTVSDNADATILTDGPFCSNDSPVQFQSEDGGGSWSGTGISGSGLFNPSAAGPGTYTITYGIAGNCGDTTSRVIIVNEAPLVSITHNNESCIGADDGDAILVIVGGTSPFTILWSNGSSQQTLEGLIPGDYSVLVTDQNGCSNTGSVSILGGTDDCNPPHVWVPNVFSPNGDGENDVLFVRGEGIKFLEFIIYNRWGEKVFETTSKDIGWDGMYKGKMCDPAVFSYILKAIYNNNDEIKLNGTITLVK
jgi:gliding motility-associated-like protein